MRPVLKTIYEAAKHPHLSATAFRLAIVQAVERRDKEKNETIEEAFKRYVLEAIFEYERKYLAK